MNLATFGVICSFVSLAANVVLILRNPITREWLQKKRDKRRRGSNGSENRTNDSDG